MSTSGVTIPLTLLNKGYLHEICIYDGLTAGVLTNLSLRDSAVHSRNNYASPRSLGIWLPTLPELVVCNWQFPFSSDFFISDRGSPSYSVPCSKTSHFAFSPLFLLYLDHNSWYDSTDTFSLLSALMLTGNNLPLTFLGGIMRAMTSLSGLVWESTSPATWEGSYMDSCFCEYTLVWEGALVFFATLA